MKYFPLVWAALFRRKVRMVLTLLSVLVAFLLFGLLDTVRETFSGFGQSTTHRLITFEKRYRPLPLSLLPRIREVPGVTGVEYGFAFGGTYQDPKNYVAIEGHSRNFYSLYPELEVAPEERAAFYRTRTGALAGEALMKKHQWRVGDKISLKSPVKLKDGSDVWTFDVVGMYRFKDPGMKVWENILYTSWDYIDQARESDTGTISWYSIKVSDPSETDRVSQAIDAMTANSGHETKTQSENAFSAAMIGQMGDLGRVVTSVMGAVFFTLLLLTGHTMMHAVHERIPEIAVLKTIGFKSRSIMGLVLGESVLLLALGSVLGLIVASLIVFVVRSTVGLMLPTDFPIPIMPVGADVWLRGMGFAILIGLIVGLPPALRGLRLRIVDALSGR